MEQEQKRILIGKGLGIPDQYITVVPHGEITIFTDDEDTYKKLLFVGLEFSNLGQTQHSPPAFGNKAETIIEVDVSRKDETMALAPRRTLPVKDRYPQFFASREKAA